MTGPTVGALERLFQEVRDVLHHQISFAAGTDEKAASILRFNAILLGLLVTSVTLVPRTRAYPVPGPVAASLWAGFALLIASSLLTVSAYQATKRSLGLRAETIAKALEYDANEGDVLRAAIRSYAQSVTHNSGWMDRTSRRLSWTLWLLSGALIAIALGATMLLIFTGDA